MKILKVIGAAFCGLMVLGGISTFIPTSGTSPELDVFVLIITLIFFIFTVLLVRSIRKNSTLKKTVMQRSSGASGKPTYIYQKSCASVSASTPVPAPSPEPIPTYPSSKPGGIDRTIQTHTARGA